jgi:hypothetical protein
VPSQQLLPYARHVPWQPQLREVLAGITLTDANQGMSCCKAPELTLREQLLPAAQHKLRDRCCVCGCLLTGRMVLLVLLILLLLLLLGAVRLLQLH